MLLARKDRSEPRQNKTQQEYGHYYRHDSYDDRIDHRSFDLRTSFGF